MTIVRVEEGEEIAEIKSSEFDMVLQEVYNKAVDDFTIMLLTNDVIDRSVVTRCAIQLKVGARNDN